MRVLVAALALLAGPLRALAQGPDHALCFDAACDLVDRGLVGGMNATLNGTATCVPETGLVCDGSDGGYADLNDVELGGAMSFEALARWDALGSLRWSSRMFDFGDGLAAHNIVLSRHGTSSSIYTGMRKEDFEWVDLLGVAGGITVESWTHLVVTIDEATLKLFQDGELVGTADAGGSAPPLMTRANHYLCKSNYDNPYLEGAIASLRIWSRALSADEVAAAHADPFCRPP